MADLVKPYPSNNESLQQISCKGESKRQSKQKKTNKLILRKHRKLAADAQLKALDDVISEVASQQELDSSYTDADDDLAGEPSTQFVNSKNKLNCTCCEEVYRLQHKSEYSRKVDNQLSEIMYLQSRISFLLTYLDNHDQPEQCNQSIDRSLLPSNQTFKQIPSKSRLVRLCKLTRNICKRHCRLV